MFIFAILTGIYSYLIFGLGLAGFLYKQNIVFITVGYILLIVFFQRGKIKKGVFTVFCLIRKINARFLIENKLLSFILFLIFLQLIINLTGALGPELAFDALWYHLTLPKLYLANHTIFHVPGGLLYYSDMPKLTEMLYAASLAFGNEMIAKLVHFSFGILSMIALYKLSRKYFSQTFSFLSVLIFYSNLVVGWQSTTVYVDLARTFFEIMALFAFVNWFGTQNRKWLIESAIMLGLAISTKLLAVGSLATFSLLVIYIGLKNKTRPLNIITNILVYWCFAILIVLPWLVVAFVNTGNPLYPFFSNIYKMGLSFNFINPFIHRSDSISLAYIGTLLALPFVFKKLKQEVKLISFYSLLALIIWYFTPKTDTGRFILPYLPAFSIVTIGIIREIWDVRRMKAVGIAIIVFISFISIIYRGIANAKYLSVLFGKVTKTEFLARNLNFSFGDFYDTDSYFKKNIKKEDKVLLYGFHNLYYVDFPFIDSSWVKKGDLFNYIAAQNTRLPQRFAYWKLAYYNPKTKVALYSLGGKMWTY